MPAGGAPVPFVPGVFEPNTSIADLILRAGNQRAEMQSRTYAGLGDTVAQLGQIPGRIQHEKQQQALIGLETAKAERQRTRDQIEMSAMQRQAQQRDLASRALGGNPTADIAGPPSEEQQAAQGGQQNPTGQSVLDPEVITQRLTRAGADPETIKSALSTAKDLMQTKQEYRQSFADLLGQHALSLLPHLGTPLEAPAVHTALASLAEEGVPKDKLDQIAQAYQQHPESIRSVLIGAITQSPKALKDFKETYGQQTKIGEGDRVVSGLGLPGGGQVIAEGAPKPKSLDMLIANTPRGTPEYADLLKRKAEEAQAAETPDKRALDAATLREKNAGFAGTPGSARFDKSNEEATKVLDATRKPAQDLQEKVTGLKELLNQRTQQADSMVAAKLLSVEVGGQGSGLRMTKSELDRVEGGRSSMEDIRATLNKVVGSNARIPDDQREQMVKLADILEKKAATKANLINQTSQKLRKAGSVDEHRQIMDEFHQSMTAGASGEKADDPLGIR